MRLSRTSEFRRHEELFQQWKNIFKKSQKRHKMIKSVTVVLEKRHEEQVSTIVKNVSKKPKVKKCNRVGLQKQTKETFQNTHFKDGKKDRTIQRASETLQLTRYEKPF